MTEFDDAVLRAALRDLHDAAVAGITPPGLPAVQRKARRRAAAHLATVTAAAIAALLTIFLTVPLGRPGPGPVDDPTASATPDPSGRATATPTPTPTEGASAQVGQSVACDSNPRVGWSSNPPRLTYWRYSTTGAPICAGVRPNMGWVSYYYLEDGRQEVWGEIINLIGPDLYENDIQIHSTCPGDVYIFAGSFTGTTLQPGQHNPFPIASAANNWQGTVYSSIVASSPCVTVTPSPS